MRCFGYLTGGIQSRLLVGLCVIGLIWLSFVIHRSFKESCHSSRNFHSDEWDMGERLWELIQKARILLMR